MAFAGHLISASVGLDEPHSGRQPTEGSDVLMFGVVFWSPAAVSDDAVVQ